jgi:hypothetical protein
MTIAEFSQLGTICIASLTGYIAIRTFRRSKRQEFENQLYKIRLEALSNIAFEMDNFFIALSRGVVQLELISKNNNPKETAKNLEDLSLKIDDEIYKCHSLIVKYSVYFTEKSNEKLLIFTNNLLGKLDSATKSENTLEWVNQYYDQQLIYSNQAIESLRNELQLKNVHSTLYTRLK